MANGASVEGFPSVDAIFYCFAYSPAVLPIQAEPHGCKLNDLLSCGLACPERSACSLHRGVPFVMVSLRFQRASTVPSPLLTKPRAAYADAFAKHPPFVFPPLKTLRVSID
jgi:hypothetical protein